MAIGKDHFGGKAVQTLQTRDAEVAFHHFQGGTSLSTSPTFVVDFLYDWLLFDNFCLSLHRHLLFFFWFHLCPHRLGCGGSKYKRVERGIFRQRDLHLRCKRLIGHLRGKPPPASGLFRLPLLFPWRPSGGYICSGWTAAGDDILACL